MPVLRKAGVSAQIPTLWARDLYTQAENMTFWHRFEGPEGSSMPVIRKDDLEKEPGDTVKFDIVLALVEAGSTGDTSLTEGNEEAMKFRQISMTVDALKHGVRWSKLAKILVTHNMRNIALRQLRKWLAGKLDDKVMTELIGTGSTTLPTTAKYFAGDENQIVDLTAADVPTLNSISDLKAKAQVANNIEPLAVEGDDEFYGLLLHPYAALGLKKSADYQQAQREAQIRGRDNPLFRGSVAMWDGVAIYTSNRVVTANDGAASATVARNIFFGSQAVSRGYAYYPDWREQEFSYGEEIGVATFTVFGQKMNAFDLTSGGGAAAADFTAIGHMVYYSGAPAPVQA